MIMDMDVVYSIKLTRREAMKLGELLKMLNRRNIEPLLEHSATYYSAPELAEVAMDIHEKISSTI